MPWIENVSADSIPHRKHHECGPNAMLIQIMDPASWFPTPAHDFKEVHQFEFLDVDGDCHSNNGSGEMEDMSEWAITHEQAKQLVVLLQHALDNRMNVVVHCFAGLCRSGAVAEVGVMLGFDDVGNFRSPNERVLQFMLQELGIPHEQKIRDIREDWRNYMSAKFD